MSSPKEYRDHVTECLDCAKAAQSDAERQIYLDMAKAWLETAVQADIQAASVQAAQAPQAAETDAANAGIAGRKEPAPGDSRDCANDNQAAAVAAAVVDTVIAAGAETGLAAAASNNAPERDEPAIQWNCVLDAAVCP